MRIGLFSDCYHPTKNGVTTSLAQLKEGLEQRGHQVRVFTVQYPGYVESDPTVTRVPSLSVNAALDIRWGWARPRALAALVARERLDLIHTHTEFSLGWAGKRAARRLGLPLIHTAHTLYEAYRHYLPLGTYLPAGGVRFLLARFLRPYTVLVCPSVKAQHYFQACVPALTTTVIGNGVSRARFNPQRLTPAEKAQARADLGLTSEDHVILSVGRIAEEKRVGPLWRALLPLLRQQPRVKAVFVGDGPAAAALRAAVRQSDVCEQVIFTGTVAWESIYRCYLIADVFVTASLSEVHPMTLLEAALCGLPIVARRDAGYVDLVQEGRNGYLVAADEQLPLRLAEILADREQRRRFSANSLLVAERFSSNAHVTRMEALYRAVLA